MKKYVKKAEKRKGEGQEETDRVTAADIAFMGKHRNKPQWQKVPYLNPRDQEAWA